MINRYSARGSDPIVLVVGSSPAPGDPTVGFPSGHCQIFLFVRVSVIRIMHRGNYHWDVVHRKVILFSSLSHSLATQEKGMNSMPY